MALRYQKPPLVEALCEVRFASTEERRWDWTVPGMLYERIRDRFPTRKEHHTINLPVTTPVPLSATAPSIERLQFMSGDENTMVQVGPDLLAVNSLRPHLGWAELRDTLLDVLATYREIASPSGIAMTAVRYINRVEIPNQSGFALEKYFKVLPGLPAGVSRVTTTFVIHTEVEYEAPAAIFRFLFGTTESKEQIAAFMLDYEHVSQPSIPPTFDGLRGWLDAGHDRIERAFYGSFTPMTHAEIFQEIRS
jgi:uncharacterized protein (TIGR04255 family)